MAGWPGTWQVWLGVGRASLVGAPLLVQVAGVTASGPSLFLLLGGVGRLPS